MTELLLTRQHARDYETLMLWLQASEKRLAARKALRPLKRAAALKAAKTRRQVQSIRRDR